MADKRNIEYFKKLQEFVLSRKPEAEFRIMYKTYWDKDADEKVMLNYTSQIKNLEVYEEEEDSYEDSYYDSYDD